MGSGVGSLTGGTWGLGTPAPSCRFLWGQPGSVLICMAHQWGGRACVCGGGTVGREGGEGLGGRPHCCRAVAGLCLQTGLTSVRNFPEKKPSQFALALFSQTEEEVPQTLSSDTPCCCRGPLASRKSAPKPASSTQPLPHFLGNQQGRLLLLPRRVSLRPSCSPLPPFYGLSSLGFLECRAQRATRRILESVKSKTVGRSRLPFP